MRPATEARYRAATERKYGPWTDEKWAAALARYEMKRRAHAAVAKAVEDGTLTPRVCAMCRSNESEAHHPDYFQPLSVVWMCRSHHQKEHSALRRLPESAREERRRYMLNYSLKQNRETVFDWLLDLVVRGESFPSSETEEIDDAQEYLETIVDYDEQEVAAAEADSENCPPVFVHAEDR